MRAWLRSHLENDKLDEVGERQHASHLVLVLHLTRAWLRSHLGDDKLDDLEEHQHASHLVFMIISTSHHPINYHSTR